MTRVYRVQDCDGRGPYKPGMSHLWADAEGDDLPPTWMEEFGWHLTTFVGRNEAMGCGFRTLAQAVRWFTPTEREKLRALGYALVSMKVDRILAESEHQLVFARRAPLHRGAAKISWPQLAPVAR